MTAARTGTARNGGVDIYYEDRGDPSAPAAVLIMGLNAQLHYWPENLVADLLARGFRVVQLDNRDVGLSGKLTGVGHDRLPVAAAKYVVGGRIRAPYTLFDLVADSEAVLDALGIERAHLVGASMGGMVAQLMAAERPGRVASLTSIMSSPLGKGLPVPRLDVLGRLVAGRPVDRPSFVHRTVETYRVIHGRGHLPFAEDRVRAMAERAFDRCFHPAGAERQLVSILATGGFADRLAKVRAPATVVHGDSDPLVRPAAGAASARAIPGARFELISGMGHGMPEPILPRLAALIAQTAGVGA